MNNQPFFSKFKTEEQLQKLSIKKVKRTSTKEKKPIKKEYTQEELCEKCNAFSSCISPKMTYRGKGNQKILIILNEPTEQDDEQNKIFSGLLFKVLNMKFHALGFDIEQDCWVTYGIRCFNKRCKTTTDQKLKFCRNNLHTLIKELQPKKIVTFGVKALKSLIGHKESIKQNDLNPWLGWEIPDQEFKCFVYPLMELDFLVQEKKDAVQDKFLNVYLQNILRPAKKFKELVPKVNILKEEEIIKEIQKDISLKDIIALDIETSGLKPHKEGHFIYSISITRRDLYTYSFLITEKLIPYLKKLLEDENIGKIIQNVQFEYKWCKEIFNIVIKNIIADTQLISHVLQNKSYITGLKFQTYVNFGIHDYSKEIEKFIVPKEKGGYEFNTIKKAPVEDLLTYNGYDTFFTMALYLKQLTQLDDHLKKGHAFFLEGCIELAQLEGIRFDKCKSEINYQKLTNEINDLHDKIMSCKEVNKLENKENFNYESDQQLGDLLFYRCNWKPIGYTGKGKPSVAKDYLQQYNKKFTNLILRKRKLLKARDTYLQQFTREAVQKENSYYIFPFFSLNNVTSYRSASQAPNFQNIPSRDNEVKVLTRSCLIPRRGHKILEIDGKAMEVTTSCLYHKDPVMSEYVSTGGDMHKDVAVQLFLMQADNPIFKEDKLRYKTKNGFVFPSFYGSTARIFSKEHKEQGYGDITGNIWAELGNITKDHLANNGIKTIFDFQNHVEEIERHFWGVRFKVYQQWKYDIWNFYKENGYIELKTGFRCNSIMSFNEVCNYPIQGTAFHILLRFLIKMNQFLRKEKFNSVIVGQIHDSLVMDIDPAEWNILKTTIHKLLAEIRKEWDWIIVPITIEAEMTGIDEPWYKKQEIKL